MIWIVKNLPLLNETIRDFFIRQNVMLCPPRFCALWFYMKPFQEISRGCFTLKLFLTGVLQAKYEN